MKRLNFYLRQLYRRRIIWLAFVAAISYSSWPLSYILNPIVGEHQLASQLEAPHQPFNWLFISTDVLAGIVLIIIGILQIKANNKHTAIKLCAIGYMTFGLLVTTAALLPINCDPQNASCGPLIHQPILIIHGLSSILSVLALFFGMMVLGLLLHRRRTYLARHVFTLVAACWFFFGLGSILDMKLHFGGNILQYFFISVCSISIVLVIATIEYLSAAGSHELDIVRTPDKLTIKTEP